MKLWFFLFSLSLTIAFGQSSYSKVRIYANDSQLGNLESLGIPADHGARKRNTWLDTDLSSEQIELLSDNNFNYDILIEDVQTYYIERSKQASKKDERVDCNQNIQIFNPITPNNFHLGTYAGFYTYQEYLNELDSMASLYPNLITVKAAIDTFLTHEGRPIYWVKISDNPNTNETEPEVLYSALHHAREPASLSQLIFYMWYLLENYDSNSEIAHIINETELFFIPMLNPDGYLENEVSNPNGGGMHRKNKRNVGTTNPGVDLNRNYDYQWNVSGTSPNVNNDTYAGTHGFSEPETQAMKFFCESHDFKFALNAHSYSNLLLFPFGYANGAFAADHDYFQTFSNHQVMFNNYDAIKSSDLYAAAGDSDDWMYDGDLNTKPKIYALTPEVGTSNDGFWPQQNRILPLCKENIWPNTIAAHLPNNYGVTTDQNPIRMNSLSGYLNYSYQRLGLTNGTTTIDIEPIQNISIPVGSNSYTIILMDIAEDSVEYTLPAGLTFGDEIIYVLNTNFGGWTRHDTIVKIYGTPNPILTDNANNIVNWSGTWNLTNAYFVSPSTSITDSPGSNYSNGANSSINLIQSFNFQNSTYAFAQFYARWEIENDFDFVQFMASTNNGVSWSPLCGNYTNIGTNNQDEGEPLYDNNQTTWVQEEIDLSDYLGMTNVQFKFRLVSDNFVVEDGFAFDDFKILADGQGLSVSSTMINRYNIYPNPANDFLLIENSSEISKIEVYNQFGQLVTSKANDEGRIDVNHLSNGVYFVKLYPHNSHSIVKKISILR
ncbi:MAG: M14 family zinc carboxypeptidase [Crocinitomicaceae bacterium]